MQAEPADRRSLPRVFWGLYRTFGPHLRPYASTFAIGYAAMGAAVLTKTLAPYPLKWILDYVLLGKPLPEGAAARALRAGRVRAARLALRGHGRARLLPGPLLLLLSLLDLERGAARQQRHPQPRLPAPAAAAALLPRRALARRPRGAPHG